MDKSLKQVKTILEQADARVRTTIAQAATVDNLAAVEVGLKAAGHLRRIIETLKEPAGKGPSTSRYRSSRPPVEVQPPFSIQSAPGAAVAPLLLQVQEFPLSVRTRAALERKGIVYIGELAQTEPAQLLALPNFGRHSLEELGGLLGTLGLKFGLRIPDWVSDRIPELETRFAREIQQVRLEQAERTRKLLGSGAATLENDLLALVAYEKDERKRKIHIRYYGWDGTGTRTLQQVGSEFGMTRERVRQITSALPKQLVGKLLFMPVLDRALEYVESRCPASATDVERGFPKAGISKEPFCLEGIINAAKLAARPLRFEIATICRTRYVLPASQVGDVRTQLETTFESIVSRAKRSISTCGCGNLDDFWEHLPSGVKAVVTPELVREILAAQKTVCWLGRNARWFWISGTRNPLLNRLQKILAVAGRVHIADVVSAVSRDRRNKRLAAIPRAVLLALCKQLPAYRVEGDLILGNPPPRPESVLSRCELALFHALRKRGLTRRDLAKKCSRRGVSGPGFVATLTRSPTVTKLPSGIYCLISETRRFPQGSAAPLENESP